MELKHLDTFIQVAELSSFTKAAEKLGYSQPTISFQIKQLETQLNAQLFERINHTVTLTERGEEVLQYAHQICKLAREMEQPVQTSHAISGHIRIAMADSLCNWLLQHDFESFHNHYPGIALTIIAASTEEMFRLLNQNETDLVYTLDNHIYDRNYVIVSEEKVDTHFVVSPAFYQENLQDGLNLKQFVQQPFLLTEKGMSYRRLMDEKLASMSLEIQPLLETGNANLICQLVEQGMGISLLPDYITEPRVKTGHLIRLDMPELQIDIWKQLLYHRDKWISPQMQAVMNWLSERQFTISP